MKARLLKKLLNDTGYHPGDHGDYIAVGSPLCHDLFKVDKQTMTISYALDTFNKGREELVGKSNKELLFIWDRLHELVASGEMSDIICGDDDIADPLPVWTFDHGALIETTTDRYGWPNTTREGKVMYENTHFRTREEAIEKGIQEYRISVELMERIVDDQRKKLERTQNDLATHREYLDFFLKLKEQL